MKPEKKQDMFSGFTHSRIENSTVQVKLCFTMYSAQGSNIRIVSLEHYKTLNILIPKWIGKDKFGYSLNFKDKKIKLDWLHGPFDNEKGSVIFDDTIDTGNTVENSREFLVKNGSSDPEVIVISKVPKQ